MKKELLIICLIFLSNLAFGQQLRLNRNLNIDTLNMWINYPIELESEMRNSLDSIFRTSMSDFNNSDKSFIVKIDSNYTGQYVFLHMEPIRYVSTGRSILMTGVDLILVSGHIFMIANAGWTLPIWPFLLPATISKIDLEVSKDLVSSNRNRMFVNPNGYFKSKVKQKEKFKLKFHKRLNRLLTKIEEKNEKGNMP